jgi:hypothetical protein
MLVVHDTSAHRSGPDGRRRFSQALGLYRKMWCMAINLKTLSTYAKTEPRMRPWRRRLRLAGKARIAAISGKNILMPSQPRVTCRFELTDSNERPIKVTFSPASWA